MARFTPPGQMRRILEIQKPRAGTANSYGESVDTWVLHRKVYARVEELSAREYIAARAVQSALSHRVNIRYCPGVDSTMRAVLDGDRFLYIESVRDIESLHREMEILATEMVGKPAIVQPAAPATSLEKSLVAKLTADATVAALVVARIRPVRLRQDDALPAIVYRRTTSTPVNTGGNTTDTASSTVSVECLGQTYTQTKVLAAAVRAALNDWTDDSGTPKIASCHLNPEGDNDVDPIPSQDAAYWTATQDFLIWHARE